MIASLLAGTLAGMARKRTRGRIESHVDDLLVHLGCSRTDVYGYPYTLKHHLAETRAKAGDMLGWLPKFISRWEGEILEEILGQFQGLCDAFPRCRPEEFYNKHWKYATDISLEICKLALVFRVMFAKFDWYDESSRYHDRIQVEIEGHYDRGRDPALEIYNPLDESFYDEFPVEMHALRRELNLI